MKRILAALALLALGVSGAGAQTDGTNTVLRNGYCFNATTGQMVDCVTGAVLNSDAARDRDHVLAPLKIFEGAIAAGAADTTIIVDLSSYRTVALMFQISRNGPNDWISLAVSPRYNFAGASDSLSIFTIPVSVFDDSLTSTMPTNRRTTPTAAGIGAGEFSVIVSTGPDLAAAARSTPQGKVVPLAVPAGFIWPSSCSFRIANTGREAAAVSPTIRVWVTGTAL